MNPTNSWQRGFWNLMATQFQNAFSDNALKGLVTLLVLAMPMADAQRDGYISLAAGLFAAPFILFAILGGWMADHFSKQRVMVWVKSAEIAIMLFAAIALGLRNLPMELAAIFFMGCHSAIFGPSKYGILPEILPTEKLSWGNGILELLTFLGIILGTVASGFFADSFVDHPAISGLILTGLAIFGWHLSNGIPKVAAAAPHCEFRANPVTELWAAMKSMRPDRDLWRANWGNTGFFFVAALVQINLVIYAKDVLHLSGSQNSLLNASLAIGIGVGSVVAGYASHNRIEYRLIPLGSVILALSTVPMGIAGIAPIVFKVALVSLGFGAGLFIVPIAAVLQHRPAPERKGAIQGAASVLSFIGILGASMANWLLHQCLAIGQVFWFCGAVALGTGIYVALSRRDEVFGRRNPPAADAPEKSIESKHGE